MQPQQNSRIDLADLKAQMLKRIGPDRFRRYFNSLGRLLSQKLSKTEFNKSCCRFIGRENLSLHNQLISSILKNACHSKTPPPIHEGEHFKSPKTGGKGLATIEDNHEKSKFLACTQSPGLSNGIILPVSPRKGRSVIRDRKPRDRPSPLGPNGKIDCTSHHLNATEDNGGKIIMENGNITPCDFQRPMRIPQGPAEQLESERSFSLQRIDESDAVPVSSHCSGLMEVAAETDCFSSAPLLAPLGIPFCSASIGGARKSLPMGSSSSSNFFSYFDSAGLSDTDALRTRMEHIAVSQGLGGVSVECANTLNNMLDLYLKRLIKSCVELVGARSINETKRHLVNKQIHGKLINGVLPSNHLHIQGSNSQMEFSKEQRTHRSVSLLDFKVAMELNPQQLGEDWPLLLEKICMNSFEE